MSDREGGGLDQIELLGGAGAVAAADVLGRAGVWAHVLWRRRCGALAHLPG